MDGVGTETAGVGTETDGACAGLAGALVGRGGSSRFHISFTSVCARTCRWSLSIRAAGTARNEGLSIDRRAAGFQATRNENQARTWRNPACSGGTTECLQVGRPRDSLRYSRRVVLVRGAGLDVVYPALCALGFIAAVLVGVSAWRFRGQMR